MKAVILATIGTPKSSKKKDVRAFLQQFLMDKNVINLPYIFRYLLVNGICIPFSLSKSVSRYQGLEGMTGGEMPLRKSIDLLLQSLELDGYKFFSYLQHVQNVDTLITEINLEGSFEEIIVLPLAPQKTFSSYISLEQELLPSLKSSFCNSTLRLIAPYFRSDYYIQGLQKLLLPYIQKDIDLYVASFHSIPLSHQRRGVQQGFNYEIQCYDTAQQVFSVLPKGVKREVLFQSAIKRNKWINPQIETVYIEWIQKGYRKVVILFPGFAFDCLETIWDIGQVLQKEFVKLGGESLQLVPCLNATKEAKELYKSLL